MANKIQIRRGTKAKLPTSLAVGEPAYTTDTHELFVGTGSGNVNMSGTKQYLGTALSGTTTTTNYHSYSSCPTVKVGDTYLNTSNGNLYECTTAGSGSSAKWTYRGCFKGVKGDTGAQGATGPAGANGTNGTNGAKGERGANATLVVAASNSSAKSKAAADYVCDGTSDQTEINNAISALPSDGGKVLLLEGTYNISGSINLNKANVTLEGMGAGTLLQRKFGGKGVISITRDYCTVSHLTIDGGGTAYSVDGFGIDSENTGKYITISYVNIRNEFDGVALNSSRSIIHSCFIDLSSARGRVGIFSGEHNTITNNVIIGGNTGGLQGIQLNASYCLVEHNYIEGVGIGIILYQSYCKISNNYIVRGLGTSKDYTSDQMTISVESSAQNNIISDNYIPGKNYVNNGGDTNMFNNNIWQADNNKATGEYACVVGGDDNNASGTGAVVVGGTANTASDADAVVCGGGANQASGLHSFVGGGYSNTALAEQSKFGHYSTIGNAGSITGTTGDAMMIGNGTSGARSNAFRVSYAGQVYGKSAFNSTGADYAEFFE